MDVTDFMLENEARAALDLGRIAKAFVNLRDARSALAEEFKTKDAALRAKQAILEGVMLKQLQAQNVNSVSTDSGTIYRQEEITPTGADWDTFYKWVREHDAFDALERRIKKNFVKQYMEEHEGAIIPGVNIFREYVVRVRRS